MEFFIPAARSKQEAESVYENIAEFISEPIVPANERIYSVAYKHNGMNMVATVGKSCDDYYNETKPTVIAIFKGNPYKICLADRGVIRGEPIFVGEGSVIRVSFFKPI